MFKNFQQINTVILPILANNRCRTVSKRIRPFLIGYETYRSDTVGQGTIAERQRLLARIGRITVSKLIIIKIQIQK